jgi:GNAT superfamily N-acetyltransferase
MSAPVIRAAKLEDAPEMSRLIGELGYPSAPEAMRRRLERLLADPGYATYVADGGEQLEGVVGVMRGFAYNFDEPFARIVVLVVDQRRRGQGTGAALVAAAEAWARGLGAGSIHLTTASHRDGAHAFYPRVGYAATGTRFYKKLG